MKIFKLLPSLIMGLFIGAILSSCSSSSDTEAVDKVVAEDLNVVDVVALNSAGVVKDSDSNSFEGEEYIYLNITVKNIGTKPYEADSVKTQIELTGYEINDDFRYVYDINVANASLKAGEQKTFSINTTIKAKNFKNIMITPYFAMKKGPISASTSNIKLAISETENTNDDAKNNYKTIKIYTQKVDLEFLESDTGLFGETSAGSDFGSKYKARASNISISGDAEKKYAYFVFINNVGSTKFYGDYAYKVENSPLETNIQRIITSILTINASTSAISVQLGGANQLKNKKQPIIGLYNITTKIDEYLNVVDNTKLTHIQEILISN
jgi:hypothetical protein